MHVTRLAVAALLVAFAGQVQADEIDLKEVAALATAVRAKVQEADPFVQAANTTPEYYTIRGLLDEISYNAHNIQQAAEAGSATRVAEMLERAEGIDGTVKTLRHPLWYLKNRADYENNVPLKEATDHLDVLRDELKFLANDLENILE